MTAMRPAKGSCCARCSTSCSCGLGTSNSSDMPELPRCKSGGDVSMVSAVGPLIHDEMVGEGVGLVQGCAVIARRFAPARAIEVGKSCIAAEVAIDLGQIQQIRARQRLAVERLATDDEHGIGKPYPRERFVERSGELDVRR